MKTADENGVDVSIVTVCTNKVDVLFPCLQSIIQRTREVSYEILVVLHQVSADKIEQVRNAFPAAIIIESNDQIRGFAENNNLAFRRAKGKYCFVVNDDTVMEMPVIDLLFASFRREPRATIFSPAILNMDGSIQHCGGRPHTMLNWLLFEFKLRNRLCPASPYENQNGIFITREIMSAAFMIPTQVFRELGFFDERYFFGPEDAALADAVQRRGGACYVNADVKILHKGSTTLAQHSLGIVIAMQRGQTIFLSRGKIWRWLVYSMAMFVLDGGKAFYWALKRTPDHAFRSRLWLKAMGKAFTLRTTKDLFLQYYRPAKVEAVSGTANNANGGRKIWS